MVRVVLAAALMAHGLGHISGFLAAWTRVDVGFRDRNWLFSSGVTMKSGIGRLFGLIWLLAMVALTGSGAGLILRQAWWPTLALAGSILSLVSIIPWWNAVVPGAKVGAAFDLFLIVVLATPIKNTLLGFLS